MIGQIISWIVFGLVVGLIARALYPGRQHIGLANTIALGIAGSLVGGFIGRLIRGGDADDGIFTGAGWIMSIIGALIVVWIAAYLSRRAD